MKTHGSAVWQGGIKDGKGAISTKSGALKEYPYGFSSRFEGKPGTNPEELIGAAHAGCFTMALSLILGEAKLAAERMETTAESARWRHDFSGRFCLRDCEARLGGNQVRDFGCALDLESVNCILQHAVSIGDAFVLAQMFEPGFHQKGLNHPT
jgi:OsmC subfamily peroxiredoxin